MLVTVNDLIQEIRDQSEEPNTSAKSDAAILRALNRGMRTIQQVLAREYPGPLLTSSTLDLSDGASHAIPDNCFDGRIDRIEVETTPTPTLIRRREPSDAARLASSGTVPVPASWHVAGTQVVFQQTPSGTYDATLYYVRRRDELVKSQGQITTVGATYVVVDSIGDDVDDDQDAIASYVNIINRVTGEIRASFQISSIVDNRINLRSAGVRTSVLGRTISGYAALATAEVAVDDYVCLARGTCVPQLQDTLASYLSQYATEAVLRSVKDGDARLEQQLLGYARDAVASTSAGHEATASVQNRSSAWPSSSPRRYPTQG